MFHWLLAKLNTGVAEVGETFQRSATLMEHPFPSVSSLNLTSVLDLIASDIQRTRLSKMITASSAAQAAEREIHKRPSAW